MRESAACGSFMVHNKKELPKDLTAYDLVIYGHSHKYEEREDECFYLNPGSCGPRRFSLPVTMAVVEVEDGVFHVFRKDIASVPAGGNVPLTESTLISLLRDVDKGRSVFGNRRKISFGRVFGRTDLPAVSDASGYRGSRGAG